MNTDFTARLKAIVGPEYVLTELEDRICYSFDATFRDRQPDVIARPGTVEEISSILALAHELGVPVTPRGASTGLSGGAVPVKGGLCLDVTRLNSIIEIDPLNKIAVVEPGVITDDFNAAVKQAGLFYPPDPASSKTSTIGGNIAECSGGPHGVKYGVTRDYVLGLEAVLADGTVVRTGNPVDGESAGPDWTMLLVGSEGTLAVVTKIFLRLVEKPEAMKTLLAVFDNLDNAAKAVCAVIASGIIPTTIEIMDNLTIRAVEDFLKAGLPTQAEAILLIEVDGSRDGLDRQAQRVSEVCRANGAGDIQVADTPQDSDRLWRARRAISSACGQLNPTKISEDATVPRSQVPAMVRKVKEIAQKYNLKMVIFGHAGDGNLHPTILCDRRDKEEFHRVEQAVDEIFDAALSMDGTLSGEHGIGIAKSKYMAKETNKASVLFSKRIKLANDPKNLLNPSKILGE